MKPVGRKPLNTLRVPNRLAEPLEHFTLNILILIVHNSAVLLYLKCLNIAKKYTRSDKIQVVPFKLYQTVGLSKRAVATYMCPITLSNTILTLERFILFLTVNFTLISNIKSKFFHYPQFLYNDFFIIDFSEF